MYLWIQEQSENCNKRVSVNDGGDVAPREARERVKVLVWCFGERVHVLADSSLTSLSIRCR